MRHCASTSSLRVNSVASPRMASVISRSYASGDCDMNAAPYRNSMFTGRMTMRVPGILAPSCSETPSFGCTVSTSWLGRTPSEPSWLKARCGTGFRVTAISVILRARRLPVRT